MKIKDYLECIKDGRRKKNEKLIRRILTAALILYILVCSLSDSIHKGADKALSSMIGRVIVIQEDNTGIYEKIKRYFQEDERVDGVYPYVYAIFMQTENFMEESGDYDESHYHGFEYTYYYAIFLADRSYAEEILKEAKKEFGSGSLIIRESQDSIANIFDAIRAVSGILSVVLLIVLITVLVMGVVNDIEERGWEFAMKLAFGYQRGQLVLITFLEYIRLTLGAFIITILFSVIFNIAGNYIIENFLPEELMCIHLSISGYTAAVGLAVVILTAAVSVPIAFNRLKSIHIKEKLKAED